MAFAMPTVRGTVKRFLRDYAWDIHVARADQEAYPSLALSHTRNAGSVPGPEPRAKRWVRPWP